LIVDTSGLTVSRNSQGYERKRNSQIAHSCWYKIQESDFFSNK